MSFLLEEAPAASLIHGLPWQGGCLQVCEGCLEKREEGRERGRGREGEGEREREREREKENVYLDISIYQNFCVSFSPVFGMVRSSRCTQVSSNRHAPSALLLHVLCGPAPRGRPHPPASLGQAHPVPPLSRSHTQKQPRPAEQEDASSHQQSGSAGG